MFSGLGRAGLPAGVDQDDEFGPQGGVAHSDLDVSEGALVVHDRSGDRRVGQ